MYLYKSGWEGEVFMLDGIIGGDKGSGVPGE